MNINAPYYAPSDKNLDLWISYGRKISRDVRWWIQLNVFNVGGQNRLVPIAAGADPIWASKPDLVVGLDTVVPMITTSFSIKQGMSWQLTNTFEF